MAITKAAVPVLPATPVLGAGGTTKASPATVSSSIDCTLYYGGEVTYKITNGTAPGVALSLTLQTSHDGANWYDYFTTAGDTITGSTYSGSILLDRGVMYLRAIAYAVTTNAVTVEVNLQAVTGV